METVIATPDDSDFQKPKDIFKTAGGTFKLVNPLHPHDTRFRPEARFQVRLMTQQGPFPAPLSGKTESEAPKKTHENVAGDAQVLARIERMIRAEQRSKELEDENRVLTRTIARLQTEIDRLKETSQQ